MDAQKKKTLEEFMVAVPEEEIQAKKPLDTIVLDEPTKKVWLSVLGYSVVFLILIGISYTGYRVYLSNSELTNEKKVDNSSFDTTKKTLSVVYVNSEGGLNLRTDPSADANVLEIIPDKTKLTIDDEDNGWIQVTYNNQTGWCKKELTQAP